MRTVVSLSSVSGLLDELEAINEGTNNDVYGHDDIKELIAKYRNQFGIPYFTEPEAAAER